MARLTDTQAILLSTASQRNDCNLLPLSANLDAAAAAKAMTMLLKRGLVEEREVHNEAAVHRTDGDRRFGLFLTPAGGSAIGVELSGAAVDNGADGSSTALATPASKPPTKGAVVIALLRRTDGATLPELIEATGWLPHTTRAALTGLRKKGHDIARTKRDGATCYGIAEQA